MPFCSRCGIQLAEGANFCHNCGAPVTPTGAQRITQKTFNVSGVPKVIVSNRAPGTIEISPSALQTEVGVDLRLKEGDYLEWNIAQNGDLITINCRPKPGILEFPGGFSFQGARADIAVKTPKRATLDLTNRFGEILVNGIEGDSVNARSSVGSIRVQGFDGTTDVRTNTGMVNLEGVNGIVRAKNSAGSISYSGKLGPGDSSFTTRVGSIDIALAGELNLLIDAMTRVGRVTIDPSIKEAQFKSMQYGIGSRVYCTIGSGDSKLFSETMTGTISIARLPVAQK